MTINFDVETSEINSKLKRVERYLDCEKIIIHNIKKQLDKGFDDEKIIVYLEKLSAFCIKKLNLIKAMQIALITGMRLALWILF